MSVGATLYVRGSLDAVALYQAAFGLALDYHVFHEDGAYLHAELHLRGEQGFAVSESRDAEAGPAVLRMACPPTSLGMTLDTEADVRRAYAMLSEGGHVIRALGPLPWSELSVDLVDRFGVCWYITVAQHRPD